MCKNIGRKVFQEKQFQLSETSVPILTKKQDQAETSLLVGLICSLVNKAFARGVNPKEITGFMSWLLTRTDRSISALAAAQD